MRLIVRPKVFLVGSPSIRWDGIRDYLQDFGHDPEQYADYLNLSTSQGEILCDVAGRTCYDSFTKRRPGGPKEYVQHILEVGHGSVLEHATFNFVFADVSRTLTHELVRHRAGWAYSQRSQRYVDESNAAMVVPFDLRDDYGRWESRSGNPEATKRFEKWYRACEESLGSYRSVLCSLEHKFLDGELKGTELRKRLRQTARSVLPGCVSTVIMASANVRALRHFIEMRASRHADPEIRQLAVEVWETVQEVSPLLFGDYQKETLPDGTVEVKTPWRKV